MKYMMLLAAVVLSGCGVNAKCNETNCAGCCDSSGTCVSPATGLSCGAKGSRCVTCNSGQSCVAGQCSGGPFSSGGGSAAAGGGSDTGGGTASAGGGSSSTGGGSAAGGGSSSTGGGTGSTSDGGLSAWETMMLNAHNAARARTNLTPPANPQLGALVWSDYAKSVATQWANNCTWMHNPQLHTINPPLGENIYASTQASAAQAVVDSWMSEEADYVYATNFCPAGKQCGHYTQIVWRNTTGVGCAFANCTSNSPFASPNWYFVVCDYAPPGNVVGSKPY